jgi:hypothetical protein
MVNVGMFTTGSAVTLDETSYYIRIYRFGDEYHGHWECTKCGLGESTTPVVSTDCHLAIQLTHHEVAKHQRRKHAAHAREVAARN